MTKVYTMISNKSLLDIGNVGGTGLNARDKFILKEFGGKIFTDDIFFIKTENFIKTSPKFGSRGGKLGCEKRTAKQLFGWWLKRGAIFEIE